MTAQMKPHKLNPFHTILIIGFMKTSSFPVTLMAFTKARPYCSSIPLWIRPCTLCSTHVIMLSAQIKSQEVIEC